MTGERVVLKQAKSLLDRIDQRPAQLKQVAPAAPGENESRQRSAGGRSAVGKLAAKLGKRDRFAALDLGKAGLQRGERIRIGENLSGLLQRLVLVYRNQSRGWRPVAGNEHVIAPIAHVVEQAAEVAAQLSHGNGLSH